MDKPPVPPAVTFQLAEVTVPRSLFAAILDVRIDQLRAIPGTG